MRFSEKWLTRAVTGRRAIISHMPPALVALDGGHPMGHAWLARVAPVRLQAAIHEIVFWLQEQEKAVSFLPGGSDATFSALAFGRGLMLHLRTFGLAISAAVCLLR